MDKRNLAQQWLLLHSNDDKDLFSPVRYGKLERGVLSAVGRFNAKHVAETARAAGMPERKVVRLMRVAREIWR